MLLGKLLCLTGNIHFGRMIIKNVYRVGFTKITTVIHLMANLKGVLDEY